MKKLLIFFVAVLLLSACNNNGGIGMGGGGWSSSEKSGFMKQCTQSAAGLGEEKAKQYCACTLEKIQKKYPKYSDANAASNDEITAIGRSCINGMNGENNGEDYENNGDDFNMNGKKKKKDNDNYGEDDYNGDDNGGFNAKGANWSKSDKNSFISQCRTSLANAGYNSNQANQLCGCVLEKLQKKYSSLSDADRRGGQQAGAMARQECENGGGGGYDDNDDDNDNY